MSLSVINLVGPKFNFFSKWGSSQKVQQRDSPLQPPEPRPSPKERYQKIQSEILDDIIKYRDKCSSWEDVVDVSAFSHLIALVSLLLSQLSHQNSNPTSVARAFVRIPVKETLSSCYNTIDSSFRLRYGRGGRLILDRMIDLERSSYYSWKAGKSGELDTDVIKRQEERWRYDSEIAELDQSTDEVDRFLLDDFNAK